MKQCEVVKKIGDISVVKLYVGNEESRVYGDVHTNKTLLAGKHNAIDILQEYGVDEKKHFPVNPSESWYDLAEEALREI
ncbi:hypothetical protein [Bacillus mycoides]|uniref:hypothetical protein n=1 Tax=Bacillus mycoides TaxID=1405 RepID=UPI000BF1BF72|nr:hypothetical protein [Bacillus mycoides]PEK86243.1 hypothetical protein CN600_29220 [Bacillus mycoides]